MACRVFRAVKLGFIKDGTTSNFGTTTPSSRIQFSPDNDIALKRSTFDNSTRNNMQVNVEIVKTSEMTPNSHDDYEYGKPTPKGLDASDQV